MYAIVDVAGQQFKVETGQKIFVHRLDNKEGDVVDFDQVLLIDQDSKVIIGEPLIKGALVTGKVLSHPRGDKVNVFKKKRRKGYKVMTGHRQNFTQILIETIVEKSAKKKTVAPKTTSSPQEIKAPGQKNVKTPSKESKPAASKKTGSKAVDSGKVSVAKTPTAKAVAGKAPAKKATAAKTVAKKAPAKKAATAKPATKKAAEKKK